jgi:hypothetical protein
MAMRKIKPIDEKKLTKGQIRKLTALRKSLGDTIAEEAFTKWLKTQATDTSKTDSIARKLVKTLAKLEKDKSFTLGRKGYVIKRAKGRGASGFVVEKVE